MVLRLVEGETSNYTYKLRIILAEFNKKMNIDTAFYLASFPSEHKCPRDDKPEYAFIGRSNVGKSSLINMLTNRKDLARTSKKPGKTQMLNYYLINDNWYIVDLPGYGYAKISKVKRKEWSQMIHTYLQKRQNLQCAFVLLDSNIPPQKIDMEFINWMGEMGIPFVIVYTKYDRLKKSDQGKNIELIEEELLKSWNSLPQRFTTSSNKGMGRDEILSFIESINAQ